VAEPTRQTLSWAAGLVAPAARVTAAGPLGARPGPWWVDVTHAGGDAAVVLRARRGDAGDDRLIEIEAAALRAAVDAGVPAPTLVGFDPTGAVAGQPAIVSTRLAGSSDVPTRPTPARLHSLGRAVGRLSIAVANPAWSLPVRDRPLSDVAFDTGADGPAAELRTAAAERLATRPPAWGDLVLVHGDCWQGNAMWTGDDLVGFIDWDAAGVGPAGIDLSGMRLDAALYFGADAADGVTAGWIDATGADPLDIACWDLVATLATPADLGVWIETIRAAGRPDLDVATVSSRRDDFTRRALASTR
jgi:aminoglycoside phosphotransferase (APT) family kinase protein